MRTRETKRFVAFLALCASLAPCVHAESTMKITSSAFADGTMLPARFTADGANVNPPLHISAVPAAAKSLVLIVDDPDAPAGPWNHWLLWNIAPETAAIAEDAAPKGAIAGKNDFGRTVYLGPSPPSGTHRYFFRLFALDKIIDLPPGADRVQLDQAMQGHVLASAELIGRYRRSRQEGDKNEPRIDTAESAHRRWPRGKRPKAN